MKLIKKHIIGLFLTLLVTGSVVLPLAHDVYHAQLKAGYLASAPVDPLQHTHTPHRTIGNQCHRMSDVDASCLLCTLAPILAIQQNAAGDLTLDEALVGADAGSSILSPPPPLLSIRGPPHLA